MARTAKIPRYNEFNELANCFGSHQKEVRAWQEYLKPQQELTLEVGCGKAEVSLELARQNPEQNFIGVDLKSDRMWRATKTAQTEQLSNIAFIQSDIRKLEEYIQSKSVKTIWITFPDPFPRERQSKHRMTGATFLELYKKLLIKDGVIKFKTDDPALFEWSLEQFVASGCVINDLTFDLYDNDARMAAKTQTTYEKRWLQEGKRIHYAEIAVS